MRRREFMMLLGGATVAGPLGARAQQSDRKRLIGVLMGALESDPAAQSRVAAFRGALAKLGWTEGGNLRIELRWSADPTLSTRYAAELVALGPRCSSPTPPRLSRGYSAKHAQYRSCSSISPTRSVKASLRPSAPRRQRSRLQRFRRANGG